MKDGFKTTEFWMTVCTNLATAAGTLHGVIPAQTAAIIIAVANGIYGVLRTVAKTNQVQPDFSGSVQSKPPPVYIESPEVPKGTPIGRIPSDVDPTPPKRLPTDFSGPIQVVPPPVRISDGADVQGPPSR